METAFWIKLCLGFLVGSAWVTLSTLASEKYGSKIGGLIGGYPSTVVIALLFIGLTQGRSFAVEATTIMPVAQGLNGLFVIVFMLLAKRGLFQALAGGLLAWFILALCLVVSGLSNWLVSIVGWICCVYICFIIVEKKMTIVSCDKIDVQYTPARIMWRALLGGSVIAAAVLLSKLTGPLYGGVLSVFPAVFLSTLTIAYSAGGARFARAMGKSMVVSGMINVAIYAILVRHLYAWTNLSIGTGTALVVSCISVYLTYLFIRTRLS